MTPPKQILNLVAVEGLALTTAGAVLGALGALAAGRALRSMLYGVGMIDPLTLVSALVLVSVIAIAASLKPAWTASRTDPTIALRAD